ncbi:MAG TPA: hypothetical protein DCS75_02370 [Gemmatimonadetes bacterium]|nr:hypothetical protein [Gemmatimonadota bacterium]HBV05746.1 hypothetical protein [Gemmatimonadota bacterium]|tara:strand:- start:4081 stop:6513 length:2433 start_codon:yes stop_codon:yes gene_type:complete
MSSLLIVSGARQSELIDEAVAWSSLDFGYASVVTSADRFSEDQSVIDEYCVRCHSDRRLRGNLSLETFDVSHPEESPEIAEKVIVKLRAGMMPPPGSARPGESVLLEVAEGIETLMDQAAIERGDPGGRTFQRLNRVEYSRSVESLLGLTIDPANYLPLDTKSENFDNIADVQMLSPTLLDAYLTAAADIARMAVGDIDAGNQEHTYTVSGYTSQVDRVDGAPFGTRGGTSVVHNFPADGDYVFSIAFQHTTTGVGFAGQLARGEKIEISIDGDRVALMDVDPWLSYDDPWGITMRTDPIAVRAGPRRVTAAFLTTAEGPVEDLVSPHDWSISDRHTGMSGYGLTLLPHLRDLVIRGPERVTGISEHPVRERVFTCRPTISREERPCAQSIIERIASDAYRRPLQPRDVNGLMRFYDQGAQEGGFEIGVRTALQAILASPHFVFRFERGAEAISNGKYAIGDHALASRLSFFLWARPPDDELRALAEEGRLSDETVLKGQVRRMLADSRIDALGSRFAAQWLRLQDLDKVNPDSYWFPDYDQQLANAMRTETQLFFTNLVREDGSVLDLYTANYSFLNERLANHYGVEGVLGDNFRRVEYPDARRQGLLGHGSILTLTSHPDRTSPVLRGKWVMEVLMGAPPPPPPPGVPDLEETEDASNGLLLSTRERMEAHRANPSCNSCHRFIDPIGLALDNYDVIGRWRIREQGAAIDTRGELYDGTQIDTPAGLVEALLRRPEPLLRTFTSNLMAYGLGRRVEYTDQPTVRAIVREAADNGYRMSSFVLGVVMSDAFRMQSIGEFSTETSSQHGG